MSETINLKELKKQKEKMEKLMSVLGEEYNEWLYQQHQNYIVENSEKAFEQLLVLKEKFSSTKQEVDVLENKQYEVRENG
ncbi:hypothetical protein COJ46_22245 [Bacillus sp. AFS077874]|uniref:hypothetical protein n=1 Tax=Bacillaceae TaxID=186817 RepID=UPI000BF1F3C3|nr:MULTISPECIES: hypothetical protein [unclassified Bacillus (in: firmicutes)]PEJ57952.1 hypothetical protein CN692_10685 [Bacillus sp. AFS002410]PFM75271.1 hypothetical protein COJ46_22245 [Bacillus sp. AFS077874]